MDLAWNKVPTKFQTKVFNDNRGKQWARDPLTGVWFSDRSNLRLRQDEDVCQYSASPLTMTMTTMRGRPGGLSTPKRASSAGSTARSGAFNRSGSVGSPGSTGEFIMSPISLANPSLSPHRHPSIHFRSSGI
mmetsp:Transcript_59390/g.159029  ORF Transcript_59390/g.159029 Transcript_59390/m.159029 type:complete len:132 (+) Transcript_59390:106-501(+)